MSLIQVNEPKIHVVLPSKVHYNLLIMHFQSCNRFVRKKTGFAGLIQLVYFSLYMLCLMSYPYQIWYIGSLKRTRKN